MFCSTFTITTLTRDSNYKLNLYRLRFEFNYLFFLIWWKVLESGHSALLSSCWYLNYIKYGSDWLNFYRCVPAINDYSNSSLFLGGEACMWSEFVDETNVLPLSWPRASATAEVLWSHELNETEAKFRLEEHVCRMRRRGIPAQPASGPNYCPY